MTRCSVNNGSNFSVIIFFFDNCACICSRNGVINNLACLVVIIALVFLAYANAALINGSVGVFLIF